MRAWSRGVRRLATASRQRLSAINLSTTHTQAARHKLSALSASRQVVRQWARKGALSAAGSDPAICATRNSAPSRIGWRERTAAEGRGRHAAGGGGWWGRERAGRPPPPPPPRRRKEAPFPPPLRQP